MEVMQVLHMNKGGGETSYAKNSNVQRTIITATNSRLAEAMIKVLCNNKNVPESIGIADLGCSSGPNTLMVVSEIINIVHATCRKLGSSLPELRISLNDLPGNDFNGIFMALPEFYERLNQEKGSCWSESCYIAGVPGSFYGRLFPQKSMHFLHSSSSLHWLSQVPSGLDTSATTALNKGKIYISKTSPTSVLNAYISQFHKDFSSFLRSRSPEMVPGGRMLLSMMGRSSFDPTTEDGYYQWELLGQALSTLVSKGLVVEEKLDSFNAPYYAPCVEEVESAIEIEGSFTINGVEAFEVEWDASVPITCDEEQRNQLIEKSLSRGQQVAKTIRAVVESMLESQFGKEIMDDLFRVYSNLVDDYISKKRAIYINLVVSLTRKEDSCMMNNTI